MYRVLSCLATQHDYWMVALAACICIATAVATFKIQDNIVASVSSRKFVLLILVGVCSASGIWATHFVAMLAFDSGMPVAFEASATIVSLLCAMATTTVGFAVASDARRWSPAIGGMIVGAGIGVMHYSGMGALLVPGVLTWHKPTVLVSVALGALLSSAATHFFRSGKGPTRQWAPPLLLSGAICGLHFTAMGALTIVPDPTLIVEASRFSPELMAAAVTGATLLVILAGVTSSALMESQLRRLREEELRQSNVHFDIALNNMNRGLCLFDAQQRVVVANVRYREMYGLHPEDVRTGVSLQEVLERRVKTGNFAGGSPAAYISERMAVANENKVSVVINELADGRVIEVGHYPTIGGGWVTTHDDITERRRLEQQIAHLAHHDALTGLPNRRKYSDHLDAALMQEPTKRATAVLSLDLDRFKQVNDIHGHPIGDRLLQSVADRLRHIVRKDDIVARMAGDEFSIIQLDADQPTGSTALAARVIETVSAPYEIEGHRVAIGISVGIALAPQDGNDAETLTSNADLALYSAKAQGKGIYRMFDQAMHSRARFRRQLENDLQQAIEREEFELNYQPIVETKTGDVIGFEALLRWRHRDRGLVSPAEFIPVAEEMGVMGQLGAWVLKMATLEAARWPADCRVAVNISPLQFKCRRLDLDVLAALATSGLPARRLEMEITESVLLGNTAETLATLHRLRDCGVRIALDDFGTGYSSLSYLHTFPFDKIKIDRTFIRCASSAENTIAIIQSIIGLGRTLGMITTAEGVETLDQLSILRQEGCTEVQGYLFSQPVPAVEIPRLLMDLRTNACRAACPFNASENLAAVSHTPVPSTFA